MLIIPIIVLSILLFILVICLIMLLKQYWKSKSKIVELEGAVSLAEKEKEMLANSTKVITSEFKNISTDVLDLQDKKAHDKLKESLKPYTDTVKQFADELKKLDESNKENFSNLNTKFSTHLQNMNTTASQFNVIAEKFSSILTSSSRHQGIFGEEILEQILSNLGFKEGINYERQFNSKYIEADSKNIYDILVYLPSDSEEKSTMIIDSKTPLNSYANWANSKNKDDQDKYAKEFIKKLKHHINDLSSKNYEFTKNTQNFVILFVPFENAMELIRKYDNDVLWYASQKNICIATPNSLIITLKLVLSLANKYRNIVTTKEIMKLGNEMHTFAIKWLKDTKRVENDAINLLTNIQKMNKNVDLSGNSMGKILDKLEANGMQGKLKFNKKPALKSEISSDNVVEVQNVIEN